MLLLIIIMWVFLGRFIILFFLFMIVVVEYLVDRWCDYLDYYCWFVMWIVLIVFFVMDVKVVVCFDCEFLFIDL